MSKMSFRSLVAAKRFSLPMLAAAAVVTLAGNAAHAGGYPTKLNVGELCATRRCEVVDAVGGG